MAYRLLVVPGENEALRSLSTQFEGDVAVQMVDSANDALWEVRQSPPTVIVADVDLPGMSGLDLAELLPNFGVPTQIVLWSTEPNQQVAKQAADAGVHHFLNGPYSPDQLKQVLYDVMQKAATAIPEPEPPAPEPVRAPEPAPSGRSGRHQASAAEQAPPPRPALPSAAERRAARAAAAAAAAPAGTAPASTPAPASAPAPAPAPPPPARRPAARRREGPLVMTTDNLTPIRNRLTELQQEVGAQCILLTDPNGMVLTEIGRTEGIPTMILLPMLSTSFSAAGQISQMLRESESSALYMQEGTYFDLYCFDVLRSYMLVLVFDKAASATKIGTVWVYAKRAIRDVQDNLS